MDYLREERQGLVDKVKKMLGRDISFVKDIMDAAMEKQNEYVEAMKHELNTMASNAIHDLLAMALEKNMKKHPMAYTFYAKAIYLTHPTGYNKGVSPAVHETTKWFCDTYFPQRNEEWELLNGVDFGPLYEWWISGEEQCSQKN